MSNKNKLYFSKTTKILSSKNKLEKDVLELVESMLNRQLFCGDELNKIFKDFKHGIELLNQKHIRCKPCQIVYEKNDKKSWITDDLSIYNSDLFHVTFYAVRGIDNLVVTPPKNDADLTVEVRKSAL